MDPRAISLRARLLGTVLAAALGSGGAQATPTRVVSLDLCMDWAVAEFTEAPRVAALSPWHLRYPIAALKGAWPSHDGSLEEVVSLKPDLIVVGQYSAKLMRERLSALGFRVEVLALPRSLAEVEDYERRLRTLLAAKPEDTQPAPQAQAPKAHAPRLLLLGANGLGTGHNTFEHQIIEQAGFRNYLNQPGQVALDLEQLIQDPPEAILFTAPTHRALAYLFAEHPVLKQRIAPKAWLSTEYWRWQCPGPWTWDLIRQLKQWHDTQAQA